MSRHQGRKPDPNHKEFHIPLSLCVNAASQEANYHQDNSKEEEEGEWGVFTGENRNIIHPSLYLKMNAFFLCLSSPLGSIIDRERKPFFLSFFFQPVFLSICPFTLSSDTREVSSLPQLKMILLTMRKRRASRCGEQSAEMKKRMQQTWTLQPAAKTMMKPEAWCWSLAESGSSVHPRRSSAGTAPVRGVPYGVVAYRPVPLATPVCRFESRSDGRSRNCPNSLRIAGKDLRPDLETQKQKP